MKGASCVDDLRDELREIARSLRGWMDYSRESFPEGALARSAELSPPVEKPARAPSAAPRLSPPTPAPPNLAPEPLPPRSEAPRQSPAPAAPLAASAPAVRPAPAAPAAPPQQIGFRNLMATLTPEPAPKVTPKAAVPRRDPPVLANGKLAPAVLLPVDPQERKEREAGLAAVAAEARACKACRLCEKRTRVVVGEGPARAPIMLVGEGPGEQEDLTGLPFVGASGQLLTKIISATGFEREDVFIGNTVKCRPPGNRNPEPDELDACAGFLEKQIDLVAPKVIVTLGKFAAQALLKTQAPIMRLRGNMQRYRGVPLMPTLHPAYLLRNPESKRLVWEDMREVRRTYDELIEGL
jgi:DNA polymerase